MPDNEVLAAIKILDNKVVGMDKKLSRMSKTLFGPEGQGGMLRTLVDLQSTVVGIPTSADDRGLIGNVKDIEQTLDGTPDSPGICSRLKQLSTDVKAIKKKQNIWNKSLTGAQLLAWVGLTVKFLKG